MSKSSDELCIAMAEPTPQERELASKLFQKLSQSPISGDWEAHLASALAQHRSRALMTATRLPTPDSFRHARGNPQTTSAYCIHKNSRGECLRCYEAWALREAMP